MRPRRWSVAPLGRPGGILLAAWRDLFTHAISDGWQLLHQKEGRQTAERTGPRTPSIDFLAFQVGRWYPPSTPCGPVGEPGWRLRATCLPWVWANRATGRGPEASPVASAPRPFLTRLAGVWTGRMGRPIAGARGRGSTWRVAGVDDGYRWVGVRTTWFGAAIVKSRLTPSMARYHRRRQWCVAGGRLPAPARPARVPAHHRVIPVPCTHVREMAKFGSDWIAPPLAPPPDRSVHPGPSGVGRATSVAVGHVRSVAPLRSVCSGDGGSSKIALQQAPSGDRRWFARGIG
jgi:hypothetical protein